jgi:hypothetical protein
MLLSIQPFYTIQMRQTYDSYNVAPRHSAQPRQVVHHYAISLIHQSIGNRWRQCVQRLHISRALLNNRHAIMST